MSHQYQQPFVLPDSFHQLLKDFTREVLREQPTNIYEYGFEYFTRMAGVYESANNKSTPTYYSDKPNAYSHNNNTSKNEDSNNHRPSSSYGDEGGRFDIDTNQSNGFEHYGHSTHSGNGQENTSFTVEDGEGGEDPHDAEEGQAYDPDELGDHFKEALMQVDVNENGFLSVELVKRVISQFNLIPYITLAFLFTECCQLTDDGQVEYIEFVDHAIDLLKDIDRFTFLNEEFEIGDDDLVHDLNATELEEELRTVIDRCDAEQTGRIHIRDFIAELSQAELDLSRREMVLVLCETPVDSQGMLQYEEVLPHMHRLMFIAQIIDQHMQEE